MKDIDTDDEMRIPLHFKTLSTELERLQWVVSRRPVQRRRMAAVYLNPS